MHRVRVVEVFLAASVERLARRKRREGESQEFKTWEETCSGAKNTGVKMRKETAASIETQWFLDDRLENGSPYVIGPLSFLWCPVLSVCLSVTLVYCCQTAGFVKMKLSMEIGLSPGHIVLDGTQLLPKGAQPPIFGPCPLWPNGWMD